MGGWVLGCYALVQVSFLLQDNFGAYLWMYKYAWKFVILFISQQVAMQSLIKIES